MICLSTGAVLEAAVGPCEGAGNSELGLLRALGEVFSAGDVMLADSFYCNYFIIATLQAAGTDAVFEQHGGRITDFRRGRQLGRRDHCVRWPKPVRPPWMTREQYADYPDELIVRELKTAGRILVTTLLDHRRVTKRQLSDLYCRRWNVELDLRNIKVTLGADVLRWRTPQMVMKELWVHLLAYNLIRQLMAQVAAANDVEPRKLSFKHTVQLWTEWTARRLTPCTTRHDADLWMLIVGVRVADRPGRVEPRMKKRRPKSYPWMKKSRPQERWDIIVRRNAAA